MLGIVAVWTATPAEALDLRPDAAVFADDAMLTSPRFVDFDQDGQLEALSVDAAGTIFWSGDPLTPTPVPNSGIIPTIGDFTGDGALDFITGDDLHGAGPGLPVLYSYAAGLYGFPGDLDADGDLDLVSGDDSYRNSGGGASFLWVPLFPMASDWYCRAPDIDLDGVADLLCTGGDGVSWFLNDGLGISFSERPLYDSVSIGMYLADPLDLDSDGSIDVVFNDIVVTGNQGRPRLVLLPGDPTAPDLFGPPIDLAPGTSEAPAAARFAGRGWIAASGLGVYPLDDVTLGELQVDPWIEGGVSWADWDADGETDDLMVAGTRALVRLTGFAEGQPLREALSVDASELTGRCDVDGDGRDELLAGPFALRFEDPLGTSVAIELIDPEFGTGCGDLDADGVLDQLAGHRLLSRDAGTGTWSREELFSADPYQVDSLPGDFDADGDADLLVLDSYGGSAIWFQDAGAWSEERVDTDLPYGGGVGDLDGDGDLDFTVAGDGGVWWFDNFDGVGGTWIKRFLSFSVCDTSSPPVLVDDLDGDGDTDVLFGGECEHLYERVPGAFVFHDFRVGIGSLDLGDLDLDGDLDLVSGSSAGDFVWFERRSSSIVDYEEHVLLEGETVGSPTLVDVDGDGDLDVATSAVQVWRNDTLAPPDDPDSDGIGTDDDRCPTTRDSANLDTDADGAGDACDCAPADARVFPGATESCDAVDEDCDRETDEGFDLDGDGDTTCGPDGTLGDIDDDCDDADPAVGPSQTEIPYDGRDGDCDPGTPDDDLDLDGFGMDQDCDDLDPAARPDAVEVLYSGIDEDCDPSTPDDDLDADGWLLADDCDDLDPAVAPGALEVPYDGTDNDCDPTTRDDDLDRDGFRADFDCDDASAAVNPARNEIPYDGVDQDCDPLTPDDDLDADGWLLADDCDDQESGVHPAAVEVPYDGIDQDCDPLTADDDLDDDGFGRATDCDEARADVSPAAAEVAYDGTDNDCTPATPDDDLDADGWALDEDCADDDPAVSPDASELPYDGIDNDCAPATPDDDLDADGWALDEDCADDDPAVSPGESELRYDGVDNDCDPATADDDFDGDGLAYADDCDDEDAAVGARPCEPPAAEPPAGEAAAARGCDTGGGALPGLATLTLALAFVRGRSARRGAAYRR